jgi:hypothetical protein
MSHYLKNHLIQMMLDINNLNLKKIDLPAKRNKKRRKQKLKRDITLMIQLLLLEEVPLLAEELEELKEDLALEEVLIEVMLDLVVAVAVPEVMMLVKALVEEEELINPKESAVEVLVQEEYLVMDLPEEALEEEHREKKDTHLVVMNLMEVLEEVVIKKAVLNLHPEEAEEEDLMLELPEAEDQVAMNQEENMNHHLEVVEWAEEEAKKKDKVDTEELENVMV